MRVTFTTMVLAIFELVTRPVFSWRRPRTTWLGVAAWCSAGAPLTLLFSVAMLLPQFPFTQQSFHARQFLARGPQPRQCLGLARGELKAETKNLLAQLFLLHFQFGRIQIAKFFAAPRH